jgi:hypothetical protein
MGETHAGELKIFMLMVTQQQQAPLSSFGKHQNVIFSSIFALFGNFSKKMRETSFSYIR